MPTETTLGPKGCERDLARPPQGQGLSLRGPAEATEAMRGPAILAGEGAGANGFGDFRRSCAGCAGATAPVIHRRVSDSLLEEGFWAHIPGSALPGPAHYI